MPQVYPFQSSSASLLLATLEYYDGLTICDEIILCHVSTETEINSKDH